VSIFFRFPQGAARPPMAETTIDVGRAGARVIPEAGLPELLIRTTRPTLAHLQLGGAGIGGIFSPVPEDQAIRTVRRAWELGIRSVDTAPWYGIGVAEEVLGKALAHGPDPIPVNLQLATKVGRVVRPASELDREDPEVEWHSRKWWKVDHDNYTRIDFSRAGVLQSLAQSRQRLGGLPIHCLRLHDAETEPRFQAACEEGAAVDTLLMLRKQGEVVEIGLGMNNAEFFRKFLRRYPRGTFDNFLVSSCWNLLDISGYNLLRECQMHGISVLNASIFGSGLLWGGDKMYYEDATEGHRSVRGRWADLARRHGVSLPAVALHFALLPQVVMGVCIGCRSPEEVDLNVALLNETVPVALWHEARDIGLLPEFLPLPTREGTVNCGVSR